MDIRHEVWIKRICPQCHDRGKSCKVQVWVVLLRELRIGGILLSHHAYVELFARRRGHKTDVLLEAPARQMVVVALE